MNHRAAHIREAEAQDVEAILRLYRQLVRPVAPDVWSPADALRGGLLLSSRLLENHGAKPQLSIASARIL